MTFKYAKKSQYEEKYTDNEELVFKHTILKVFRNLITAFGYNSKRTYNGLRIQKLNDPKCIYKSMQKKIHKS